MTYTKLYTSDQLSNIATYIHFFMDSDFWKDSGIKLQRFAS